MLPLHTSKSTTMSFSRFFFLACLAGLLFSCKMHAQPPVVTTTNKKAIKYYDEGKELIEKKNDFNKGIESMQKAIKTDSGFVEAYFYLGDVYLDQLQREKGVEMYAKGLAVNPGFFPNYFVVCADEERKLGRYAEAKAHYENFNSRQRGNGNQIYRDRAEVGLKSCNFALTAIAHPVPFNPKNMGSGVNSADCEYFPAITADDATLLFTRNVRTLDANGKPTASQEDFYSCTRTDTTWSKAAGLGAPINTTRNEGAPSLSADGQYLFFAACEDLDGYGPDRKGYGRCDIFLTQRVGSKWQKPWNAGSPVSTPFWESQPSFSSDGKTLYFVSPRPGGYGNTDIWMVQLQADGTWGKAENLGDSINTAGKEEGVFIHADNQTLYFASDGHVGMGGLDIYVSRRHADGTWGKPVNLGYPINTKADESGLIVSGSGKYAIYSSDRAGGFGCEDLYQFDLYDSIRPKPISFMKGKVYDAKTKKPIAATFDLIDLKTGSTVVTSTANAGDGTFLVTLPPDKDYALKVTQPGYSFFSENFTMTSSTDQSKPFYKDVPLQPIDTGVTVVLKNIFFETAKWDLLPQSKVELATLIDFLNKNPKVKIEIGGHTDSRGTNASNLTLSQNRAKSVYDYLITNGIDKTRLSYKGYAFTRPKVNPEKTDDDMQQNRRTEFKVTAIK